MYKVERSLQGDREVEQRSRVVLDALWSKSERRGSEEARGSGPEVRGGGARSKEGSSGSKSDDMYERTGTGPKRTSDDEQGGNEKSMYNGTHELELD